MIINIGIDPGPKYTGVVVIDVTNNNKVLHSSTYTRPDDVKPVTWATYVANHIKEHVTSQYSSPQIGIEGVTTPNSHHKGKVSFVSPKYLIHLGLIVGALAQAHPTAVIVRPGKNGSRENYPEELEGRRPKTLAGIASKSGRQHERSAYDIATQVQQYQQENYSLDTKMELFAT